MSIRRPLALAASAAVIAFGVPSLKAASFLVDDGVPSAGYSTAGAWNAGGGDTFIGHDFQFTQDAAATATYTPSGLGAFTPGNYDLFVQWDVYDGAGGTPATNDARYRVTHAGGITDVHLNQQQQARQSAATGAPFANITGSGYYFLGNFGLDNASSVQLSKGAGEPTTYLTTDALYGTNDGVLIDDLSAKVTYSYTGDTNVFGYPGAAGAAIDINSVHPYANGLGDTATYTPGVGGLREVKVSWSAAVHHSSMVTYLVDLDGNPLTTFDQTSATVDMRRIAANQSGGPIAGSTQTWSEFYSLGTFALTPASTITATNNTGAYITTDQMFLSNIIPEPAAVALLLAGAVVLPLRRRTR